MKITGCFIKYLLESMPRPSKREKKMDGGDKSEKIIIDTARDERMKKMTSFAGSVAYRETEKEIPHVTL